MDNYRKGLLIFILFGLTSTAYHFLALRKKRTTRKTKTATQRMKHINEVLMFSEILLSEKVPSKYSRHLLHPSGDRLLCYLSRTCHTLDICMYMITNNDIARVILKLFTRGVKVRFIVDADMAYSMGSVTKRLEKQGIELRWMKSTNFMHHKFCLIDASIHIEDSQIIPFVMIGSLNWTVQGLNGNWENVLVTSKPEIVQGLQVEFEKLWVKFKPIVK